MLQSRGRGQGIPEEPYVIGAHHVSALVPLQAPAEVVLALLAMPPQNLVWVWSIP